ncbi:Alpha/Beta hydrolase protein [Cunninghamella echinulata]|nr:Alpha/Beta hydrolase protein [Cunninghamella echinulata]
MIIIPQLKLYGTITCVCLLFITFVYSYETVEDYILKNHSFQEESSADKMNDSLSSLSYHYLWKIMGYLVGFWFLIVEVGFYIYYKIELSRLQHFKKAIKPLDFDQRTKLYWECVNTVTDARHWTVGWFYYSDTMSHPRFSEIYRDNMAQWFSWAFWDDDISTVRKDPKKANEIDWMINTYETTFDLKLKEGYNDKVQCVRLTLDPVQAFHRPLFIYLSIYLCNMVFNNICLKWLWKFNCYESDTTQLIWGGLLHLIHHSMLWLIDQYQQFQGKGRHGMIKKQKQSTYTVPDQKIVYWYRDPLAIQKQQAASSYNNNNKKTTSTIKDINNNNMVDNKTPIVFIHGIGAGLICYIQFIYHLVKFDRPMFCVELPFVAMRMVDQVPLTEDIVKDIEQMLHRHGYKHAVFVSHSLGTAVTSWLMKYTPSIVAGSVFIDPICFLLHYPTLCFNFIHRIPTQISEYFTKFVASRELYISHYISRHFRWYEIIYFPDLINKNGTLNPTSPIRNSTVFLSEKDGIVASPTIANHLVESGVDCRVMPKLEHAGFLIDWSWQSRILEQVDWIARNVDDECLVLS